MGRWTTRVDDTTVVCLLLLLQLQVFEYYYYNENASFEIGKIEMLFVVPIVFCGKSVLRVSTIYVDSFDCIGQ